MIVICRNCGRAGGYGTVTQMQAVILGTLAGLTIFLGLPVARLRLASLRYLSLLNAFAIGILLFLFIEVMEHAVAPVEEALEEGEPGFLLLLLTVALGFGAGLLSLVYYGQRILRGGEGSSWSSSVSMMPISSARSRSSNRR